VDRGGLADRLNPIVEPLVDKLGFSIVELRSGAAREALRVSLVIYRPQGVNLDDCATVYRAVLPRIEVSENRRDVHLEVSSPGLNRTIKSANEFGVFLGRGVKILVKTSGEWITGTIDSATDHSLELQNSSGRSEYEFKDIVKAQLDYSEEVGG